MLDVARQTLFIAVLGAVLVAPGWSSEIEAPPAWLPLTAMTDGSGRVLSDRLPPGLHRHIEAARRSNQRLVEEGRIPPIPRGVCEVGLREIIEPTRPMGGDFARQVTLSRVIVTGTISHLEQGFYLEAPGVLMEIDVDGVVKSDPDQPIEGSLTYFYPWARFVVDDTLVCANAAHGGLEPRAGQRVLLLLNNAPVNPTEEGGPTVVSLMEEEILFAPGLSGQLSLPQAYRGDRNLAPHLSLEEIVDWISSGQPSREAAGSS